MISVIVSSYNQLSDLRKFLEATEDQRCHDFQVIVADDGSDDGTIEWLHTAAPSFPLIWITQPHDGYRLAASWNKGASLSHGGRLLFTNADTLHNPESFEAHSKLPPSRLGVGIVRFSDGRTNRRRGAALPHHAWGGNMSVDSKAFEAVGGFDETITSWGGEDGDLAGRLRGVIPVWVDDSVATHQDHPARAWHPEGRRVLCKSSS